MIVDVESLAVKNGHHECAVLVVFRLSASLWGVILRFAGKKMLGMGLILVSNLHEHMIIP